jgi:hypothetical protein
VLRSVSITLELVGAKKLWIFRVGFPVELIEFGLKVRDFVLVVQEDTRVQVAVGAVEAEVGVARLERC